DPDIKELLRAFFVYDQQMRQDYEEFPASISNHHGFKHGLLQHSLEVTRQVDFDSQEILRWGKIKLNRDLLIAGALLHDIGKLREYVRVGKSDF
ncbi:HDIG domain-containing metalloprotein, partial [Enterococcus faecium]|uniref:HDIG domain-containing metalloprotein n=1 Tax=Enterococcus faecium TaxID=1352 RepID=UPI0034E97E8B